MTKPVFIRTIGLQNDFGGGYFNNLFAPAIETLHKYILNEYICQFVKILKEK